MKNQIIIVGFLLSTTMFFIISFTSCAMPTISKFVEDDPNIGEIFKTASSVSLAWVYSEPGTIDSYKMYYKAHGDTTWILLETITSSIPLFVIDHSSLGQQFSLLKPTPK